MKRFAPPATLKPVSFFTGISTLPGHWRHNSPFLSIINKDPDLHGWHEKIHTQGHKATAEICRVDMISSKGRVHLGFQKILNMPMWL